MSLSARQNPPPSRGEGRPVRRRSRTFRPNYLSFSGTYQCNLSCPHCCVPIEWTDRLDIAAALRFLEDARAYGIDIVSFSGGEPFLYPEFLIAVSRRAAELGFRFDKIVTNGVWFRDQAHLESILTELAAAGFSGKLGLSVDKFHQAGGRVQGSGIRDQGLGDSTLSTQHSALSTHSSSLQPLAAFCRAARRIFGRDDILSLAYASRSRNQGLEPIRALARELEGVIEWSEVLGRYLLVAPDWTMPLNWNHLAPVERAERLGGGWEGVWFEEDYCEGPGQALVVTSRGDVKPCCGFASDLDQLTIGNIYKDNVATIVRRARRHPYVGKIFREGLTAIRDEILKCDPDAFPSATSNHCFFCWHVLTRGLARTTSNSEPAENGRECCSHSNALSNPYPDTHREGESS